MSEPTPPPARTYAMRSEVAAQAAQHVHDLETALDAANVDIQALTAKLLVSNERYDALAEDYKQLKHDRDYHQERCVRIETYLNSAASMVLEAMRGGTPTPNIKVDEGFSITSDVDNINAQNFAEALEPPMPAKNGNGKKLKTPAAVQAD